MSPVSRYQPALLGGVFIGVLSVLPLVNLGNFCCCMWVVLGGMLTVYLQQQALPTPIETSTAALCGAIAGAIGGIISAAAGLIMFKIVGADAQLALFEMLSNLPNMPPETAEWAASLMQSPAWLLGQAVLTVLVNSVVGMLGALLGLAFFRKKVTPDMPMGPMGPMGPPA